MSSVSSINTGSGSKLTAVNTNAIQDHARFYVATIKDYYRLERSSSATADGLLIVQPTTGPGRWIRENVRAPEWLLQTTWWINPSTGNDENDGTQQTAGAGFVGPIATYAEFFRRVGNIIRPAVTMTVNQETDCTEFLTFAIQPDPTGKFIWQGVPVSHYTGTLSAVTNLNASTNTPTDATASWNPTTELNRLVLDSTASKYAWVAKDLTGGKARLSPWSAMNLTDPSTAVTLGNAATSDSVTTYTLPKVAGVDLLILSSQSGTGINMKIVINQLEIQGATGSNPRTRIMINGQIPFIQNCNFSTNLPRFGGGAFIFNNCAFTGGGGTMLGNEIFTYAQMNAGLLTIGITPQLGSSMTLQSHVLFQGLTLHPIGAGNIEIVDACFCDIASPIILSRGSKLQLLGTSLWGTGNTGYGITVESGSSIQYSFVPTLTGASGDAIVGGVPITWSTDIPFVNSLTDSVVVPL